jgi:hypothetical protein
MFDRHDRITAVGTPLTAVLTVAPLLAWALLVVGGTMIFGVAAIYTILATQLLGIALLVAHPRQQA